MAEAEMTWFGPMAPAGAKRIATPPIRIASTATSQCKSCKHGHGQRCGGAAERRGRLLRAERGLGADAHARAASPHDVYRRFAAAASGRPAAPSASGGDAEAASTRARVVAKRGVSPSPHPTSTDVEAGQSSETDPLVDRVPRLVRYPMVNVCVATPCWVLLNVNARPPHVDWSQETSKGRKRRGTRSGVHILLFVSFHVVLHVLGYLLLLRQLRMTPSMRVEMGIVYAAALASFLLFHRASVQDAGLLPSVRHAAGDACTPRDAVVQRERLIRNLHKYGPIPLASKQRTFCSECELVRPQRSKHCRECQRCVARFDHHCIWLGNCVGEGNYRSFMALLLALTTETGVSLALLVQFVTDPGFAIMSLHGVVTGLCGLVVTAWFFFVGLMLLGNVANIARNVTTNEAVNRDRYDHLRDGRNPFNAGSYARNLALCCFLDTGITFNQSVRRTRRGLATTMAAATAV